MRAFVDAWWRAAAQMLHPAVVLRMLLPALLLSAILVLVAGRTLWEPAAARLAATLAGWAWLGTLLDAVRSAGATLHPDALGPPLLSAVAVPAAVIATLLIVAWLAAPAAVRFVARRRFPGIARHALVAGPWRSVGWSIASTLAALLALALSVPLWFVPPLLLVLLPWIWGWLTYRVFGFAALALHAGADERRRLLFRLRWPLRSMGLACGFVCLLPSLGWTVTATARFEPLPALAAVALYTLTFVFASLWFAHRLLAALVALRAAPDRTLP